MKYSLDPFRWLSYLINRIYYRKSKWLHFYASIPYNKKWFHQWVKTHPLNKYCREELGESDVTKTHSFKETGV